MQNLCPQNIYELLPFWRAEAEKWDAIVTNVPMDSHLAAMLFSGIKDISRIFVPLMMDS